MRLQFRILGPLEVVGPEGPIRLGGPRQRGVLAALLLGANRVMPVEELAESLYGEAAPPTAVAQVRDHVSQLRKHLGDTIATQAPGYVLRVDPEDVDSLRFERLVERGSQALRIGDADAAAALLGEALALWRGPALAEFRFDAFAQPTLAKLEELRLTALERRIEAELALGQDGMLVAELEALVAEHPLRQRFAAHLMRALHRAGRTPEAVSVFHDVRRALVDELGIEPSAELRELAGRILREDPGLDLAGDSSPTPSAVRNPYKGLHAFGEPDAGDFFGREELTASLVARVRAERFVAVVGPSGSGKSSVVFAGLLPALRAGAVPGSEHWPIAVMTAGAYPLEELEAALLRVASNPPTSLIEQLTGDELGLLRAAKRVLPDDRSELVLVVDQLEEVFTLVEGDRRRAHFLASIERAVTDPRSRLRVVITLRADFFDRPLAHRAFGALLRDRVESVVPLSGEELERAIGEPARAVGVSLEPGLLSTIVAEVVDAPAALPLMQYALTELHERRDRTTLTRAAYESIGGISGALAGRAEAAYRGLDPPARDATRQLFLRLVTLGETADTRRRVTRAELESLDVDQEALARAIDVFGSARLLSFDRDPRTLGPTVEVAHEAVLAAWARLRDWLAAARERLRASRRLTSAATEWMEGAREPSMLLRGAQLLRFEALASDSDLAHTELEREYLRASAAARQDEEAAETARLEREAALERRSLRRLRGLVGVLAAAALVAAGLTVFAFRQSDRSRHEARIATARRLAAAAVANLDVDPELSVLLALRAARTTANRPVLPEVVDALHRSIEASRVVQTIRVRTPALATTGTSRVATAGSRVDVWDTHTGGRLLRLGRRGSSFQSVAFSGDGQLLAAGADDGTTAIWNARNGRTILRLPRPIAGVSMKSLGFSPDQTHLAADDGVGDLWIWSLERHRLERHIRSVGELCGIAWSPDGARVATGDCGTHFAPSFGRVWDAATGELLYKTPPQGGSILTVAFSPDGRYLGTPNRTGVAQVWDMRERRLVSTFEDHTGEVLALAYGPHGLVATSGTDGTVRVWEAATGRQVLVLHGHGGPVPSVAFVGDGSRIVSAGDDGLVRVWNVTPGGGRDWLTIFAHRGGVASIYYSPSGARFLTTGVDDDRAKHWDPRTGHLVASYKTVVDPGAFYIAGSGFPPQIEVSSPDERYGVDLHEGSFAILRTNATGDAVARIGHDPQSVAFDPSSRVLAVGNADGTVVLWDIRRRRTIRTFGAHKGYVESLAFSPDGRELATGGEDTTAKLWDPLTGRQLLTLVGSTRLVSALAFSPDGSRLATGSRDGYVRIYVLPLAQLLAVARARVTRGLTADECRQYLDEPC